MPPRVTLLHVRWDGVPGATGYEIAVNGAKVATAGARARTSKLSVSDISLIVVTDLPARSVEQVLDFKQGS